MTVSTTIERGKPSYQVVYEHFRRRAESAGQGVLVPSRAELAKQFSVGETTVSRAIDLLKKRGYAYGRQGKGTYICERRQKSAKLQQIGFYTYSVDIDTVRYSKGFERVFSDSDYSVSIHSSYANLKRYKNTIEHIGSSGLAGVILFNPSLLEGTPEAIDISHLAEAKIPVVTMGGPWPDFPCDRVDHTRSDSARIMTEHAAARGCQNPGIFLPREHGSNADNEEFLNEFKHSFGQHNIEVKKENVFYFDVPHAWTGGQDTSVDAYHFTKKELSKVSKCDVLMFHSDCDLIGALRALRESGIKVPEQIKLLSGYRAVDSEAIIENPTTVDTNIEEQARTAAELLKKRIEWYEGPLEAHYISGRLIEGKTT